MKTLPTFKPTMTTTKKQLGTNIEYIIKCVKSKKIKEKEKIKNVK